MMQVSESSNTEQTTTQPRRVRRTGPYKAADARRQAILDAAVEHFATWGFFNASVPKIAAEVGITKAGLLHHFGSKEQLLTAVLERRDQHAIKTFFTADDHPASIPEYFSQLAAQARFNESQPGLTQMFSVLAAEASNPAHPAHDYFRERYELVVGASAEIINRAAANNELRSDVDPQQLASELIAVLDGLAVQWALAAPAFSLAERVESYLNRLQNAVLISDVTPSTNT